MFITVLTAIYASLVVALLVIYITNQRQFIIKWAENHGLKNNFFIRTMKGTPKRRPDKSGLSKVFYK